MVLEEAGVLDRRVFGVETVEEDVEVVVDECEATPRTLRREGRVLASAASCAVLRDTLASIKSILASMDLTLCCTPTFILGTFFLADF